jgi:hypothetical protein
MERMGRSVEQKAAVKRYFTIATALVLFGLAFSVFLIIQGNAGGWVLMILLSVIWGFGYLALRRIDS